jgi:hypothetical protein
MNILNLVLSIIAVIVSGVALYLIIDRLNNQDDSPDVIYVQQPVHYVPFHRRWYHGRRMWGPGRRHPRHRPGPHHRHR